MLGVGFFFAFAVLSAICSGHISAYRHATYSSHSYTQNVSTVPSDSTHQTQHLAANDRAIDSRVSENGNVRDQLGSGDLSHESNGLTGLNNFGLLRNTFSLSDGIVKGEDYENHPDDDEPFYIHGYSPEKAKKESAWYKPGETAVGENTIKVYEDVFIDHQRQKYAPSSLHEHKYIAKLYDGEERLDDMLQYAPVANRTMQECSSKGKDYIIALDNSEQIHNPDMYRKVYSFVKLLAYSLAATKGINTLSLVSYDESARKVLDRSAIDNENVRAVGHKIDEMFKQERKAKTANPAKALQFLRESVYLNRTNFLGKDNKTKLDFNAASGKDTVVFLITTGKVADKNLANDEAFIARRNGVMLFVVEIGNESEKFWPYALGCRYYYSCPTYITTDAWKILRYFAKLMKRVCRRDGRDAVCLEEWSDYSSCTKTCGSGLKSAELLGVEQVLTESTGSDGSKGRTCDAQYRNVKVKQVVCNTQRCPPGDDGVVPPVSTGKIGARAYDRRTQSDAPPLPAADVKLPDRSEEHTDSTITSESAETDTQKEAITQSEVLNHDTQTHVSDHVEKEMPTNHEAAGNIVHTQEHKDFHLEDALVDEELESTPYYLDASGNVVPDTTLIPTAEEGQHHYDSGHEVRFVTEPVWNPEHHIIRHDRQHQQDHEETQIRSGKNTKGMSTVIIGITIFIAIIAVCSGVYVRCSKRKNTDGGRTEESNFLTGSQGGKNEVAESYKVTDASDNVWA